ncbi:MAG: anthrone oxygenase family protein [Pseudomonadota bacterium]
MMNWLFYGSLWMGFVSALVAGVFLSFSDFIMRGLGQAEGGAGADAMRQINRTVLRSVFLTSFLSLVPLSVAFGWYSATHGAGLGRYYAVTACVIYVATVFLTTIAANVPMNQRLDGMEPQDLSAQTYWHHYRKVWTRWNHLRTVGAILSSALFLLAAGAFAGG